MADSPPFAEYRSRRTGVNALVGGLASILLAFLPFSPVLGGVVAGYLHDDDRNAALKVGALAGVIAFVPLVFVGGLIVLFLVGGIAYGAPMASSIFILLVLVIGLFSVLYVVGLSAVGGYLGAIIAEDYTDQRTGGD